MKILFASLDGANIKGSLRGVLKQIEELEVEKGILTSEAVRGENADLFVDFNLSGFNQTTLTDNISYNLLPCKQIHIITRDNLPNEKYLEKQLSISMFFYCTDSKYYQYLQEKYPDIPYLKEVKGWKNSDDEESAETNAKIMSEIIGEVMQICHMT